jgi:hypothetical protein
MEVLVLAATRAAQAGAPEAWARYLAEARQRLERAPLWRPRIEQLEALRPSL